MDNNEENLFNLQKRLKQNLTIIEVHLMGGALKKKHLSDGSDWKAVEPKAALEFSSYIYELVNKSPVFVLEDSTEDNAPVKIIHMPYEKFRDEFNADVYFAERYMLKEIIFS